MSNGKTQRVYIHKLVDRTRKKNDRRNCLAEVRSVCRGETQTSTKGVVWWLSKTQPAGDP